MISARLGLQRAEGATDVLTALRLPALLVDDTGRVVEANEMIQEMADRIGFRAGNKILLTDRAANERLSEMLGSIGTPEGAIGRRTSVIAAATPAVRSERTNRSASASLRLG